jgi:uncharacterized RDD family membrane protein YckC
MSAGFVSRLLAFAADSAVITIGTEAVSWVLATAGKLLRNIVRLDVPIAVAGGLLVTAAIYNLVFWALIGRTPGKWLMGLRVVTEEGGRITLGRAAVRLLGYLLSAAPLYAGFFWILLDRERCGWHDRLAGTRVVYDSR